MAAPVMSHLICSIALIILILVLPSFFALELSNISEEMAIRELTEISDYTSSTLENLFLLANSTNSGELTVTKKLIYLPTKIKDSPYVLSITSDGGQYASRVTASLTDRPWVTGASWLIPGLKITLNYSLTIDNHIVEAACKRDATGFYIWIAKDE